ncbi:hypothetical protein PROVRETT_07061 [Providencia rettgeri DSM 1131]|nr:hypothetical protein PROVRETT_07061 [Providencia rettgeri DSM 1131]
MLAALGYPSHILLCMLLVSPSYFTLLLRWLYSLTLVTYWSMLLGIIFFAALLQRELFWRKSICPKQ